MEEVFIADDRSFEQLEIAEEELIDAYVRDQLSNEEAERFISKLLPAPRISERVLFARSLAEKADSSKSKLQGVPAEALADSKTETPGTRWWTSFLPPQPALRVAFIVTFCLFLLGGTSLVAGWLRLRNENERLAFERATLEKQQNDLDQRATEQRLKNEQLTADLELRSDQLAKEQKRIDESRRAIDGQLLGTRKLPSTIASISLFPGLTRDQSERQELPIRSGQTMAQLDLVLENDEYRSYRASIERADRGRVFNINAGKAINTRSGPQIRVVVPTSLLAPGDYIVTVSGRTKSGKLEPVSNYAFRVTKN